MEYIYLGARRREGLHNNLQVGLEPHPSSGLALNKKAAMRERAHGRRGGMERG